MAEEVGRELEEETENPGIPGAEPAREAEGYPSESDEAEDEPSKEGDAPAAKANTLNRSIARSIDILFALLLAQLPGYIGFLAGLVYIGIADGLMSGRSIGKRVIGLRVVRKRDGSPADFRDSILRNSTIGLFYMLFFIPLLGWALALAGLAFELLLVIGSPEGMRLGDEIASTVVMDEKAASS